MDKKVYAYSVQDRETAICLPVEYLPGYDMQTCVFVGDHKGVGDDGYFVIHETTDPWTIYVVKGDYDEAEELAKKIDPTRLNTNVMFNDGILVYETPEELVEDNWGLGDFGVGEEQ